MHMDESLCCTTDIETALWRYSLKEIGGCQKMRKCWDEKEEEKIIGWRENGKWIDDRQL